jgi:para-nitrobenzyl esterase
MRSLVLAGLFAAFLAGATGSTGVSALTPGLTPGHAIIDAGALQGGVAGDVVSFKGVPYAKPPVGPWRWRPPQRPAPWSGVRDATRYGAICMQRIVKDNGVGPGPASEDCLTLNVFAPTAHDKALPVMVWIHGGGFVNGSGTADLYDGSKLAAQGVVVVTLNYRLGRFGFFAHPAITAETPQTYLANYGLMDQIAALQWVHRNIHAFGGDAATVTIFGESAGGMAVNHLMAIREARGLFQRAIVQSGLGREPSQTLADAEADGAAFAAKLGVTGNAAAALRALPADAIVAGGELDVMKGEAPILDGRLVRDRVMDAFGRGHVAKVPLMIGSNSLEIPPTLVNAAGSRWVEALSLETKAALIQAYGSEAAFHAHIVTDIGFGEPARTLAREHAISGHPTYLYRFSVVSSGAPKMFQGGAVHASDRQYVFKTLNASPWPTDARDAALAETLSAYWVAFARTGDPNGEGWAQWPAYGSHDELMDFTNDGPVAKVTPDAAALDRIGETYRQPPPAR